MQVDFHGRSRLSRRSARLNQRSCALLDPREPVLRGLLEKSRGAFCPSIPAIRHRQACSEGGNSWIRLDAFFEQLHDLVGATSVYPDRKELRSINHGRVELAAGAPELKCRLR